VATYTEVLCGCKTSAHRSIRWTPCQCQQSGHDAGCDGLLEIHDRKCVRSYAVSEFLTDSGWEGRAFRLTKADGAVYDVLIHRNGQDHICDCAAGCYHRVAECCHVAALRALMVNGWLDDPRNDPRPSEWPYPEQMEAPPF
jgi:hypothetical protein